MSLNSGMGSMAPSSVEPAIPKTATVLLLILSLIFETSIL